MAVGLDWVSLFSFVRHRLVTWSEIGKQTLVVITIDTQWWMISVKCPLRVSEWLQIIIIAYAMLKLSFIERDISPRVKVKNPILPTRQPTFALENQTRYSWMDGPLVMSADFYPCGIIWAFIQGLVFKCASQLPQPFLSQDLNRDSSKCLPYISFSGDSENLVFNQITVSWLISFIILNTSLLDMILIL